MNFYITITTKCNLQCVYCYGKLCEDFGSDFGSLEIDYSIPTSISYEMADLIQFLNKDPKLTIIFYGGEPLLEIEKIIKIMDNVPAERYIIQTNGLLLDKLPTEYIRRLNTVLISLDGNDELTDKNRGRGVFKAAIRNLRFFQENGFKGEFIARMTVSLGNQIDQEVLWLIQNNDFSFKSVHWQLDALFWQKDFDSDKFESWFKVYNQGVNRLTDFWIERMEDAGEVLKIYPFISIMQSILVNEPSKLRCGAGWNTFNIQTNGKITPCPVMSGMKDFYLGDIRTSQPLKLNSVFVKRPCTECTILNLCGGRCLYANATKLWGEEGYKLVCNTVINLVNSLRRVEPRVRHLLYEGKVTIQDFNYGRYNSCEIIP